MAQLLVRQVEERVVRKLKERAGRNGVSMEDEHRRILREVLLGLTAEKASFKEFLLSMPKSGPESLLDRPRDQGREVRL